MEKEERRSVAIQDKNGVIRKYESRENNDFVIEGEDVIGLDSNVLVDLVESTPFQKEIIEQVKIGVLNIFTTNVALGEAKHVLIRKRNYSNRKAIKSLQDILKEFNICKINHNEEGNRLGMTWFDDSRKMMYIKKISSFPNDCRILANLFFQKRINIYMTEDRDIEKAVKLLKVPVRIRLIGEASGLDDFETRSFFKRLSKEKSRSFHKRRKQH